MQDIERISNKEKKYIEEVLSNNFRTSSGSSMNSKLEKAFSKLYGTDYAITFINGTTTMHATLLAAGIGEGDEVIVPPLTCLLYTSPSARD